MNDSKKYDKIVFFGDSITFGHGVSVCDIFPVKIAKELPGCTITNMSHNGDTTRMALERMSFDIQPHWFNVMLIQFGLNDCNYWISDNRMPRISKESFEANLYEIIDRAFARNINEVFLLTNHPVQKTENFPNLNISLQKSNEEYNRIIRLVSFNTGLKLIDIEKEFKDEDLNLILHDGTHLSKLGHKFYAEIILPYLKKLL
jgi:lysophospholipase L1-like esterase